MENQDKDDASGAAMPDSTPYRYRYQPVVHVRDARPDRRFLVALFAWAALLVMASSDAGKFILGALAALALVIYGMVRGARPMS